MYRIVAPISWRQRAILASQLLHVKYPRRICTVEYIPTLEYSLPIVRPPENLASGMRRGTQRARASAAGFARFRLLALLTTNAFDFVGPVNATQSRGPAPPLDRRSCRVCALCMYIQKEREREDSHVTPVVGTSQWEPALAAADPNQAGGIIIVAHLVVLINCEAALSTWRSQRSWRRRAPLACMDGTFKCKVER